MEGEKNQLPVTSSLPVSVPLTFPSALNKLHSTLSSLLQQLTACPSFLFLLLSHNTAFIPFSSPISLSSLPSHFLFLFSLSSCFMHKHRDIVEHLYTASTSCVMGIFSWTGLKAMQTPCSFLELNNCYSVDACSGLTVAATLEKEYIHKLAAQINHCM